MRSRRSAARDARWYPGTKKAAAGQATQKPSRRTFFHVRLQCLGVLVDAEKDEPRLLRQERPDAVDTPTCLVRMHQGGMRQQRTQLVELPFPMARQLMQEGVHLGFPQGEVGEEVHHQKIRSRKSAKMFWFFMGSFRGYLGRFVVPSALGGRLAGVVVEGAKRPGREIVDYPGHH